MKNHFSRLVVTVSLVAGEALCPNAAHAWAWAALWPVYDGAWGHEQSCQSNTNGNWGAYSSNAGCDINSPVGMIAASANGAGR
jgi:hypothetical protein